MEHANRKELGEYTSVASFNAVVNGIEDTLGDDAAKVVLIRAGKLVGHNIVDGLGYTGAKPPFEIAAETLNKILGQAGDRICAVHEVYLIGDQPQLEDRQIVLKVSDCICTASEPAGSNKPCTFSLGAVWGCMEAAWGVAYTAEQTESTLKGAATDTFVLTPV